MDRSNTPNRHPEYIYRRRRIMALIIVVIVVVLIIWAVVAVGRLVGGDDGENVAVTETPTSETVTSTTEATTTEETTTEESTETEETEETETSTNAAEPTGSCSLSDLVITASADQPNYGGSAQPTFFMTVQNPTDADCEINLDEETLRFEVYNLATNQRVWSDVDCNPAIETGTRDFPAEDERYFQATWSRTTSAPDQCGDRQAVPAGSYYMHAVIGDNPSQALTFNLG